jgi:hypothetical protein
VTILSTIPEIPDPYLNSQLELRGRWDASPVVAQIDTAAYDLIVIGKGDEANNKNGGYRGIRLWSDAMWKALRRTYTLACFFDDMEVWLPPRNSAELLSSLSAIGCEAGQLDSGSTIGNQAQ